jgi:hypothetical protein
VLPDSIRTFHGLNRVTCVARAAGGDTILLGRHDPAIPFLDLDDWLVALRNASYAAGPDYDGVPGCTIDPSPGAADPWRIQEAKVFGMPRTAPMGARHVAIDYEMKKLAAGLLAVSPRVQSVYELGRRRTTPCETNSTAAPNSSTHRFWFTPLYPPERPRFVEDGRVIWVRHPIQVQVQCEEELLSNGRRVSAGPPHPAAAEFTRSLTDLLASDEVPRYSGLKNDFRVLEIAKILRLKGASAESLRYLLRDCPLSRVATPTKVGGIRREESGDAVCDARVSVVSGPRGSRTETSESVVHYRNEFRGGVEASVKVEESDFGRGGASWPARLASAALAARPGAGAAWVFRV